LLRRFPPLIRRTRPPSRNDRSFDLLPSLWRRLSETVRSRATDASTSADPRRNQQETRTLVSNNTLLRSTLHPPCPQTQEVVEVTLPINRKELGLADRISLLFGLWLLLRAERSRRREPRTITQEEMLLLRA